MSLRVLDLTDGSMAYAGRLLADLGADVARIEPSHAARRPDGDGAASGYFGLGTRRIALDATGPAGREALVALCGQVDAVIEGIVAPGDIEDLRDAARRAHPRLVWVAIREFDPRVTGEHGSAEIVRYALSGLMSITGDPDGPPMLAGGGLPNAIVATYAALAAYVTVRTARATGAGGLVWISAYEALVSFMPQGLLEAALSGRVVTRGGSRHAHIGMAGALPCRDGYAVISANERRMWRSLVETVGDPRLEDPALDDERERMRRQAELFEIVGEWTSRFGKAELAERVQARGIPVAPVHDPLDVARDPHLDARGFFHGNGHERSGVLTVPWMRRRTHGA